MTDVCLILEGTYPYVAGGVSSWVNDLMKELPDTTFSVVYLGVQHAKEKKMYYTLPANVYDFLEIDIFDYSLEPRRGLRKRGEDFQVIETFLQGMYEADTSQFDRLLEIVNGQGDRRRLSIYDLAYSWESWKILERAYLRQAKEHSFIDFFWTWRALYLPFFNLMGLNLPRACVYHAVSTGYAGVLGAIAKHRYRRPFLLTEHGIYTRERKLDIAQADWIHSPLAKELKVTDDTDFFRDWWSRVFIFMSRLAYQRADEIITLYEGNRKTQIEEGADPHKTRIIPNGVSLREVSLIPRTDGPAPFVDVYTTNMNNSETTNVGPPVQQAGILTTPINVSLKKVSKVGFVGRVVPIKDVKTFITACQSIYSEFKEVEFYIMGPTDEDEEYYQECVLLTKMKSLEKVIHFTGNVQLRNYYPHLDVVVLTSISESQPLVVLEAAAYGIPVVVTDVGACRELIFGRSPEDKSLGASGLMTPICSPHETAQAVLKILKDPKLRLKMGEVGKERVARYYRQEDYLASYQMLYNRYRDQVHV